VALFILPRESDPSVLLDRLEEDFALRKGETTRVRVSYLDTFDWRIMDGGFTLTAERRGGKARLKLAGNDGGVIECRVPGVPAFSDDLPPGLFRETLGGLSKVRRLLPMGTARWSETPWVVLNEDEKTVVRLLLREGTARAPEGGEHEPVPPCLRLLPLKGYGPEYRRVRSAFRRLGLVPAAERNELQGILEALGRTPERHSSSAVLPLSADLRADEAVRLIHRELLTTMRVNLDGVLRDLDPEFLHEFRVATRRARSALSQIKGVFPPETVAHFKEEFRWLGTRTGPTRDMDVYLLKIPAYRNALLDSARTHLDPLVTFLEKKKLQAHRRLVRSLESGRYESMVQAWSEFLDREEAATNPPPNAGRPVAWVARERILKVFRRILARGSQIGWDSPPEALHRLRIEGKKLRYLMTFFQSLFPPEAMAPIIGELKKLQDNLGDFNDLRVQAAALRGFAEEMLDTGVGPPATLMAMGQLMGQLEERQGVERRVFRKRFRTFARRENRRRFEELFG